MAQERPRQMLPRDTAAGIQHSKTEAGYRLLFDGHPMPMWVFDQHTLRFLAVNQAAIRAYGHSEAEFLALSLPDIRPASDVPSLMDFLAAPRSDRGTARHWRHCRRDGELIDVEIVSEAVEFAGRPARLVLAKDITVRLRTQAEAQAMARRYRDIVETATEGIWTIDAQALTTFVNPKMAQMLGYNAAEMMGRPLTDFMDAQGVALANANLDRRRQGVSEQHDFRFCRKDGSELWVTISTNPVQDEAGVYAGALAMVTDITERRRVDQQLKLLASSVARFNDIVLITEAEPQDEPGPRILFVNEAFERHTGYRRDEVLGRSPRFLQGADTDPAELRRIGAALRRWEPVRSQLLNYTRSGEPFWVELDMVPVADDTGRYTHWVSVQHDITERKRVEACDAGRDRVLRLIAAGAPLGQALDAIVLGMQASQPGLRGNLMMLDASGTRLLHGAAPSLPEAFNQAINNLAIGPMVGSCGTAAFTGQRVVSADAVADPRFAQFLPLMAAHGIASSWSEPILGATGKVLGTLGIYHGQVHSPGEHEIASVTEAAQLAAIVIERKRADDALRESQKMEALGTLARGIAHDFNNILGAILGNLALARQSLGHRADDPDSVQARLELVRQSALRARHLVQQITAFGRRQPHLALVQPLAPLVQDTLALMQASLPASVRWTSPAWLRPPVSRPVPPLAPETPETRETPAPPAPQVEVDANQIQQVLMHLCTNAWQAMPDGAGEIEVGLAAGQAEPGDALCLAGLPPGPFAHLWVRDSGSGMDEATRSHVFEPFFTTKPVGSGTGLGLAVVHGIVAEHRGVITVHSAPGLGATFHLYLPARDEPAQQGQAPADQFAGTDDVAAAAKAAETATATATAAAAAAAVPRQILCVDDDPVVLLTNAGLLERLGYVVTSVDNGEQALAVLGTDPARFDLVVTDHNMPGLSGLDLARVLATRAPALPVLICSGYIDADLCRQADALGVRGLVRKQYTVDDLGAAVQRALGGSVSTGAAP